MSTIDQHEKYKTVPHIGKSGRKPGDFGYEFDCGLEDCIHHYHALDHRDNTPGVLEIVPPYGKKAHLGIGRLIQAAPDLLAACEACLLRDDIANDELGDVLRAAIAKAKGQR